MEPVDWTTEQNASCAEAEGIISHWWGNLMLTSAELNSISSHQAVLWDTNIDSALVWHFCMLGEANVQIKNVTKAGWVYRPSR